MKDKLVEGFLEFSEEANTRSTVDIRDGLKPVHRRILYTLSSYKQSGMIGSAKVVGDTLGAWHPHGDLSVYNAAARLAKPFKTRYPLIEFKGNVGTVLEPDGHASSRYTSMKLSPLGELTLKDVKKNSVNMIPNYDESLLEPEYLPGLVPVTLINGTLGIGVGMASSIPPHNLREVAKAIAHRIDNPTSTTKDMMRFIKGPDFPTGCAITNPESLLEAYETGRGSVRIKANYEIKSEGGRTHILIKEVPYLVDPSTQIIGKLQELYNEGYEFIEDVQNKSDRENGFLIEVTLSKNAPVFEVLELILKETSIETTFGINLTTYLGDNKFDRKGLLAIIDAYISQALSTNKRVAEFDLDKLVARRLIVEGLVKATNNIDEVVKLIKASDSTALANEGLQALLGIVHIQAAAILAMRLSSLTKLDVNKLHNELGELKVKIDELEEFLASKELQLNVIKANIIDLAQKYGDDRRTRIAHDIEVGEVQDVTVFLNASGEIYAAPTDSIPLNRRNTKGKIFDDVVSYVETQNDKHIWIVDCEGNVISVSVAAIGVSQEMLRNNVSNLGVRNRAVQLLNQVPAKYIVSLTTAGVVKKSLCSDYNLGKMFRVAKLREGDEIEKVFLVNEGDMFIMITNADKYIYFNESEINCSGIATIGTKAAASTLKSFDLAGDTVVFVDGEGNAKRVLAKNLKESGRKSSGLACNNAIVAGAIGKHILVWGADSRMIRVDSTSITTSASAIAKGVALYSGEIAKILSH